MRLTTYPVKINTLSCAFIKDAVQDDGEPFGLIDLTKKKSREQKLMQKSLFSCSDSLEIRQKLLLLSKWTK